MARVKLSRGKKTEAAELAESLIGKYKLDDFEKIFRKAAQHGDHLRLRESLGGVGAQHQRPVLHLCS